MKPALSIIIPCYNSSATLEEAVHSLDTQQLDDHEVIIVDDGSTDGTRKLIKSLSRANPYIRHIFHERNKGGGAARNTGIKDARSDFFFCLDSDDMLAPRCLSRMLALQRQTGADGVTIGISRKFLGEDVGRIAYMNAFYKNDDPIPLEDLFDKQGLCPLYSTFLFSRRAFEATGGYPEDHGFDTQGFAFRFMANGFKAHICRTAEYFHRIKYKESYYQREEKSGRVSANWSRIFEEHLFLFDDRAKDIIISARFDDRVHPLHSQLVGAETILDARYRSYIAPRAIAARKKALSEQGSLNAYDEYWLGALAYHDKDYANAAVHFEAASNTMDEPRLRWRLAESRRRLSGIQGTAVEESASPDHVAPQPVRKARPGMTARIFRKFDR